MRTTEAMRVCRMTVFKPNRRRHYLMRWLDKETGGWRERTTGTVYQREAIQVAGELARKIVDGIAIDNPLWTDFCDSYETHVESRRTGRATEPWITTRRWINDRAAETKIPKPLYVADVTSVWVLRWQTRLRELGLSENTVASYSARLKIALRWAAEHGMIEKAPRIAVEPIAAPRSRAITLEEFERIQVALKTLRPDDWRQWDRLLRGQWHCGFRISEIVRLSWDDSDPIHIDNRGKFPFVVMAARANKKRKPRLRAITPEFWDVCCETPEHDRRGRVFPILNSLGPLCGQLMSQGRIERQISCFGARAGVVTNTETGKTATSHDTRRGFAVQMDGRGLTLAELQRWMDHADIRTTLTYYRTAEADELAAKLWHRAKTQESGNSSGERQTARHDRDVGENH
jgi:integrase